MVEYPQCAVQWGRFVIGEMDSRTSPDGNRGIPRYPSFANLLVKPRLVADPPIIIGGWSDAGINSRAASNEDRTRFPIEPVSRQAGCKGRHRRALRAKRMVVGRSPCQNHPPSYGRRCGCRPRPERILQTCKAYATRTLKGVCEVPNHKY